MSTVELIIFSIVMILLISAAYAGYSAAPFWPSKRKECKNVIDNVPIKPGQKFYELGCGSGTILFSIAKHHPNALFVGYDISIFPFLYARIKKIIGRYKNTKVQMKNLFKQDLADADVVFVFLMDKCYPRLMEKFAKELKDDTVVVFQGWALPKIDFDKKIKPEGTLPLYFYHGAQFREV
ncbi:MAG: class I SAM-dependent methyltransferase [Patescibacteria group bacterium]